MVGCGERAHQREGRKEGGTVAHGQCHKKWKNKDKKEQLSTEPC